MALPVALGAALLVPIDVAMIRAQFGNGHLDRGETAAALADFDAAVGLHDLPVYRLGQAIGRAADGDHAGALESLGRMDEREPFTFVEAAAASIVAATGDAGRTATAIATPAAAGPYDPTATLQLAILRAGLGDGQTSAVTADLGAVMTTVPSLIHSRPPAGLFDEGTWSGAQRQALTELTAATPSVAASEAIQAGLPDAAATARARITDPDQLALLDILQTTVDGGAADIDTTMTILRANPDDQFVQLLVWDIGFVAKSQPTIDAVARLYGVVFFGPPQPPMEIVLDGMAKADWSMRLPRYPMAASSRLGPMRPYLPGLATIEPVYRPKP
jgi:hypothetical protein